MSHTDETGANDPQMKLIRTKAGLVRISQACDRCRIKKTRCDGQMPCAKCSRGGFTCQVLDTLTRRLFPRGYTENLERSIRVLESENNDLLLEIERLKGIVGETVAPRATDKPLALPKLAVLESEIMPSVNNLHAVPSTPEHTLWVLKNYIINELGLEIVNTEQFPLLDSQFSRLLHTLNLSHTIQKVFNPETGLYEQTPTTALPPPLAAQTPLDLDKYLVEVLGAVAASGVSSLGPALGLSSLHTLLQLFLHKLQLDHLLLNYFRHFNLLVPVLTFKYFLPEYVKLMNRLQTARSPQLLRLLVVDHRITVLHILIMVKITLLLGLHPLRDDIPNALDLCLPFFAVTQLLLLLLTVQLLVVYLLILTGDGTNAFKVLHSINSFVTPNDYDLVYNTLGLHSTHLLWDNKIRLKIIWSLKILSHMYTLRFGHAVVPLHLPSTGVVPRLNLFVKDNKLVPTNLFQDLVFVLGDSGFAVTLPQQLDQLEQKLAEWRLRLKNTHAEYYHEWENETGTSTPALLPVPQENMLQTTNLTSLLILYQLLVFFYGICSQMYLQLFVETLRAGSGESQAGGHKLRYSHLLKLAHVLQQFLTYILYLFEDLLVVTTGFGETGTLLPAALVAANLATLVCLPRLAVVNCFYLLYCCSLIYKQSLEYRQRLVRALDTLSRVGSMLALDEAIAAFLRLGSSSLRVESYRKVFDLIQREAKLLRDDAPPVPETKRHRTMLAALMQRRPLEQVDLLFAAIFLDSHQPEWDYGLDLAALFALLTANVPAHPLVVSLQPEPYFPERSSFQSQREQLKRKERKVKRLMARRATVPSSHQLTPQPQDNHFEIVYDWQSNLENLTDDYLFGATEQQGIPIPDQPLPHKDIFAYWDQEK